MLSQASRQTESMTPRHTGTGQRFVAPLGVWLLFAVLLLVVYSPALRGEFLWDDDEYVSNNPAVMQANGIVRIWLSADGGPQYYPLTLSSFWLEYRCWGTAPAGYHVTNILLHATNAWLVYLLLARLSVPGALLAGAIFALHPVHVESVAWISERKNVLSGLFYLLTILAWWNWRRSKIGWAALSVLLLFALALLAKTVTCTLPLALLLLAYWRREQLGRPDLCLLAAMLALALVLGLVTLHLETTKVGAQGAQWDLSFLQRTLLAGQAFWFYLAKLACPTGLAFMYTRRQVDTGNLWHYVPLMAAIAIVALAWCLRQRWGRGPLAALLFFLVTLSPALGFASFYPMRYSFVADHFQYLASLGPLVWVAATVTSFAGPRLRPMLFRAAVGTYLLTLAGLSWSHAWSFRSLESLWHDTIATTPSCWMAHNNLGILRKRAGNFPAAARHFREALRYSPHEARLHHNLASVLARSSPSEALAHCRQALTLEPTLAKSFLLLGHLAADRKDWQAAASAFEQVVRLQPDGPVGHHELGVAQQRLGESALAQRSLEQALVLAPENLQIRSSLVSVLRDRSEIQAAIAVLQQGLLLHPGHPGMLGQLAWLWATTSTSSASERAQALQLAQVLCTQTDWSDPLTLDTLAAAQAANGDFLSARRTVRQAIESAQRGGLQALAQAMRRREHAYAHGQPTSSPARYPKGPGDRQADESQERQTSEEP